MMSNASADGCPTSGSPVVDMFDVIESKRSGRSMASCCAIIPPIDQPATCARSMPSASSTATASSAMSANR